MIAEHIETELKRQELMSKMELITHIKCIGQAIIDDAERIGERPERTSYISISAVISPVEEITKIDYRIERIADPRVKR